MNITRDFRYASRALLKTPGFLLVTALSLGLGIALNTTMFGVIWSTLFSTPDIERPDQLVSVYTAQSGEADLVGNSIPDLRDLSDSTETLQSVFAQSLAVANVSVDGRPTPRIGSVVTANFFEALGVRAALGRTFLPEEALGGSARPTVVLTHSYWQRGFGARPDILDEALRIGGFDFEIVGVLPQGFRGMLRGLQPDLFVPLAHLASIEPMGEISSEGRRGGLPNEEFRGFRFLTTYGRLAEGSTIAQAEADVQSIYAGLAAAYPDTNPNFEARLLPTSSVHIDPDLDGTIVPAAMVALGMVILVLLVACANIGNLLLARAEARRREIALRLSLGASRWQLVRLLLVESILLSLIGGLAGLALAVLAMRLIARMPLDLPIDVVLEPTLDGPVLLFTLGISLVTGLVFGLLPAARSARASLVPALKDEGSGTRAERGLRAWLQPSRLLVVSQVALSLVLLVGAGLLQRSVQVARAVDVGFEAERIGAFTTDVGPGDQSAREAMWQRLIRVVEAHPEVERAAVATRSPLELNIHRAEFFIPGHRELESEPVISHDVTRTNNRFFEVLDLEIVDGSTFPTLAAGETEDRETPRIALVNQAMAGLYWPGESAVGKIFRTPAADSPPTTIVGVVEDYKVRTPGEAPRPMVHFWSEGAVPQFGNLLYRTRGNVDSVQQDVQRTLLAAEPDLFVLEATSLSSRRDLVLLPIRIGGAVVSGLSALALVLAVVGLAGLIGYWVNRRTREIGIRVAVGADRGRITRLVLLRSLSLVAVGGLLGLAGAALLGQVLRTVLYVPTIDPVSFLAGLTILGTAAILASLIPVRRATSIDPIQALRS